ncbi:hypothetical protein BDQ12DRAFT_632665, partial [Crucibulum laeve]
MSSHTIVLPPAVAAFIAGVKPALSVLLLCAVWLGVTIPLLFVLFYFSTPSSRRKPLFIFNAISVFIGILMGALNVGILVSIQLTILHPTDSQILQTMLFYTFMTVTVDIFIDSILLFRVFSVFPLSGTRKRLWFSIFIPLILLKIARITNVVVFMVDYAHRTQSLNSSAQLGPISRSLPEPKIGWGLQLADNISCSAIFLWRLNQGRSLLALMRDDNGRASYPATLRALFWISVSNFVFPCMFAIAQYILIFRDPNPNHYLIVLISNIYVAIIGVLFATVWAATNS